jgi:hypothetical protein
MAEFTFGLRYPTTGDVEEIDVTAPTYSAARTKAEAIAETGYQPGWEMIDLPSGGSYGMVWWA